MMGESKRLLGLDPATGKDSTVLVLSGLRLGKSRVMAEHAFAVAQQHPEIKQYVAGPEHGLERVLAVTHPTTGETIELGAAQLKES